MKYPMLVLAAVLVVGCSNEQAGTGPSPTEPSPVVVTPVPASTHTRPPHPPETTPRRIGRLNPAVYQIDRNHDGDFTDLGEDSTVTTVCVPGWTKTIRPPTSYTNALKRAQLPLGTDLSLYEEDHLMPLALGGAPRDPKNLWPVLWPRAKLDDIRETRLHRDLCKGKITLSLAQTMITVIKRRP